MNNPLLKILSIYYIIINLIAFCAMYIDKQKAIKNKWRTPEKTLLTLSMLGGCIGSYLGMKTFRHKTKHTKFYVVNLLALVLHIGLVIYLF